MKKIPCTICKMPHDVKSQHLSFTPHLNRRRTFRNIFIIIILVIIMWAILFIMPTAARIQQKTQYSHTAQLMCKEGMEQWHSQAYKKIVNDFCKKYE